MSTQTGANKALIRELYRTLYEEKAFDAVPEFYAADAARHGGLQGNLEGRTALEGTDMLGLMQGIGAVDLPF